MNRFVRNRRAQTQLELRPDFRGAMRTLAQPAADAAEEIARSIPRTTRRASRRAGRPWMPRKGQRRRIVIQTTPDGVAVVNTDYAAHLMEFGSARNPPHAPLRRGVQSAGLRLDDNAH